MSAADKTAGMTVGQAREELTRLEKLARPHLTAGEAGALKLRRRGYFDDALGFFEEWDIQVGARLAYAQLASLKIKTIDTRASLKIRSDIDLRAPAGAIAINRRNAVEELKRAAEAAERASQRIHADARLPGPRS